MTTEPTRPDDNTAPRHRRTLHVSDLDRCMHGRHFHDLCCECRENTQGDRDNQGNPNLDVVVGYALGGVPFTVRELVASVEPDRRVS